MNKQPWFKFYTADWIKGTRRLKSEPKAVWADLLAYMWENEPKGEIVDSMENIGIMTGIPYLNVLTVIDELVDRNICTLLKICPKCLPGPFNSEALKQAMSRSCHDLVTPYVRVVSRRMSRECHANLEHMKRQEKHRQSGRLRKQRERDAPCDASVTRKKSEVRSHINPIVPFETFYSIYPKKQSRAEAEKAWHGLKASLEFWEKIIRPALLAQCGSPQWAKDGGAYIPLPATWIRRKRWEDEIETRFKTKENEWLQTKLTTIT